MAVSEVLDLLKAYVAVAGGSIEAPEPGLIRFTPAPDESRWFGQAARLLAVDIEQMDVHPEAEMAVMGSGFSDDLLNAIRSRGARVDRGFLAPSRPPDSGAAIGGVRVRRGHVAGANLLTAWLPVGRLHVAVSVRTGYEVDDHLVSTGLFHLGTGAPLPGEIEDVEHLPDPGEYEVAPIPALEGALPAMLDDIERALTSKVEAARTEAERRLTEELARLDWYYGRLIAEEQRRANGPDMDAVRSYEADRERRRAEEIARNSASAELRPVQVEVHHVLAQRRRLVLEDQGTRAAVDGHRLLVGDGGWAMPCPSCGSETPEHWAVCSDGHAVCSDCSTACTICGSTSCGRHGGGRCQAGDHFVCHDHAETCFGCGGTHCSEHTGLCEQGHHEACTGCLTECEACGSSVCQRHMRQTVGRPAAPSRTLCPGCVRTCRGQAAEVLGPDQVTSCATCGQDVCREHSGPCSVDGAVHCRTHLRRTDRSRLYVCPEHVASCRSEPGAVHAANEVEVCGSCGSTTCEAHAARCYADGRLHCADHVVVLPDGTSSCPDHYRICVVDQQPARVDEVERCPVCSHGACDGHRRECGECGRSVCSTDWASGRCRTCSGLEVQQDASDELLDAFVRLKDEKWGRITKWEEGRDASHRVVRVTLSRWRRTVTFCWDHERQDVTRAILSGVFRSKRIR